MKLGLILLFSYALIANAYKFSIQGRGITQTQTRISYSLSHPLYAKKSAGGKGFGAPKKQDEDVKEIVSTNENVVSVDTTVPVPVSAVTKIVPGSNLNDLSSLSAEDQILSTNMFKNKQVRAIESLEEKIARVQAEEDLIADDPSVGAVPELVADRMLGRIIAFFGIPVFGGLAVFVGAFFYSKKYDVVVPPNLIAYATQAPFILGLVGITYGILSASWEPEEEGSWLGFTEFNINLQRIRDGLKRTSETAALKNEIEDETTKLNRNNVNRDNRRIK